MGGEEKVVILVFILLKYRRVVWSHTMDRLRRGEKRVCEEVSNLTELLRFYSIDRRGLHTENGLDSLNKEKTLKKKKSWKNARVIQRLAPDLLLEKVSLSSSFSRIENYLIGEKRVPRGLHDPNPQ